MGKEVQHVKLVIDQAHPLSAHFGLKNTENIPKVWFKKSIVVRELGDSKRQIIEQMMKTP